MIATLIPAAMPAARARPSNPAQTTLSQNHLVANLIHDSLAVEPSGAEAPARSELEEPGASARKDQSTNHEDEKRMVRTNYREGQRSRVWILKGKPRSGWQLFAYCMLSWHCSLCLWHG